MQHFRKLAKLPLLLCPLLAVTAPASADQAASATLAEAFKDGEAKIAFRYRYENVDQDGISKKAHASTLRTRLNFKTQSYNNLVGFIEVDNVSYLGDDGFNDLRNKKTFYPVVADPKGTSLNQLYLDYKTEDGVVRFGRQRINLENQRFVGGVGWRQNEQTFDALTWKQKMSDKIDVEYNYLNKVNRIFGPDNGTPAKDIDSNSHLLTAKIKLGEKAKLSVFGYFMDLETAAKLSNRTIGVNYSNQFDMDGFSIPLNASYAQQNDYGDNPVSYSASYYQFETGVKMNGVTVMLGNEVLEGDKVNGKAFRTPLATLHKFQGWNDKFLSTPAQGIDDKYLNVKMKIAEVKVGVSYHDLSAETGSLDYGSEIDVSAAYKINANVSSLLKIGRYSSDGFGTDTNKIWLMFNVNF